MFCWLMSILSIELYRLLKGSFQLHVLLVIFNPINTIVPCPLGQVSADVLKYTVNSINTNVPCAEGQDSAA
jgi:hypothetical protein